MIWITSDSLNNGLIGETDAPVSVIPKIVNMNSGIFLLSFRLKLLNYRWSLICKRAEKRK